MVKNVVSLNVSTTFGTISNTNANSFVFFSNKSNLKRKHSLTLGNFFQHESLIRGLVFKRESTKAMNIECGFYTKIRNLTI